VFFTDKPRLTQKQLVEFVREIDDHIVKTYPNLASRVVNLSCLDMEKTLFTSDGSYSHSMIPRSFIRVAMTIEKDGKPVELTSVYGGLGQFEDALESPSQTFEGIQSQYEHLVKKSEGVFADAGIKTCVLDAELAGILAHEAIGHTTEADLVIGGSVAGPLLNHEAASPLVTLIDFANTALGKTCPVPVYVDDEGTKAEDAIIIEEGILKGYMHNKESAMRFGVSPTGNARAYTFSDEPLIRMRNTAILPGTSKVADMIASVDDGYYLIKPSNGQADSTSEFMFGVTLGYEIKNGKLGRAIKDTTISGVAFDLLKSVTMISDDMKWTCAGMCGKKQAIPVGMGGPAIKCKVNIGGR
jgi:TldD protein